MGIQCHWPPLQPQHAISHTASPWVYSHPGGRSLPGSSADVSPCNCPLGGGLPPRLALLTGCLPRFTFTSVLRWVSGVFIELCFLIFMLPCPLLPGRPPDVSQCLCPEVTSRCSWLFLCRLSPESPPDGPIASCPHHHPFPPWLLQRPPFWPLVSCLPPSSPQCRQNQLSKERLLETH